MTIWNLFRKSPPPVLTPQEQAAEDLARLVASERTKNRTWAEHRRSQLTGERRKRFEAAMNGEVSA